MCRSAARPRKNYNSYKFTGGKTVNLKTLPVLSIFLIFMLGAILVADNTTATRPTADENNLCEVVLKPTDIKNHYLIELRLINDQPLAAIAFPLIIKAAKTEMMYDSISFAKTRAEFCAVKIPNADTAEQKFNLGILASMTPPLKYIDPGEGPIARLYFTSRDKTKLEDIMIDTTFFPPSNHLMGVLPDAKTNISPAFRFIREK